MFALIMSCRTGTPDSIINEVGFHGSPAFQSVDLSEFSCTVYAEW